MGVASHRSFPGGIIIFQSCLSDFEWWPWFQTGLPGCVLTLTALSRRFWRTQDDSSRRLETRKFEENPDIPLEQMYPGQTGTPHPQAPSCKKARMFKVLIEVEEEAKTGSRASSQLQLSGRVRSPEMKQLLARFPEIFPVDSGIMKS